ncbi:MAG: hypothetical protein LVQ96_02765 [Thermoplasmatales archaeon]|nr:hypothetical protein [Thermoplasmatales archaeon]
MGKFDWAIALINMGFQVHVMNLSKLPQIFQTVTKHPITSFLNCNYE